VVPTTRDSLLQRWGEAQLAGHGPSTSTDRLYTDHRSTSTDDHSPTSECDGAGKLGVFGMPNTELESGGHNVIGAPEDALKSPARGAVRA
jgi:hypothetical protein